MIKAFIQLLVWFRQIGLSPDAIAGIIVTIECADYPTSHLLYRQLLNIAGKPDEPAVTVDHGFIARIAGIKFKITSRTCR